MTVPGSENVLFWRSLGAEDSFVPGSYYALCATNRRLMLLNLGASVRWLVVAVFIWLGPLAFLIAFIVGKAAAKKRANGLRSQTPEAMLLSCPGSLVYDACDLREIDVVEGRLIIRTALSQREYKFADLRPQHTRQLLSALQAMGFQNVERLP